jgi:hypothetical protein
MGLASIKIVKKFGCVKASAYLKASRAGETVIQTTFSATKIASKCSKLSKDRTAPTSASLSISAFLKQKSVTTNFTV